MGKKKFTIDSSLVKRKDSFVKNTTSEMYYSMSNSCDALNFEWLDKIIEACPFVDQIVRHPKLTLVKEEVVSTIERAKKITSESVKDLAKHSNYINDMDEETGDIRPSKILEVRNEETYNIYENRFLYTFIHDLQRFIFEREDELKNIILGNNKSLEYKAESIEDGEKINIELRITSEQKENSNKDNNIENLINKQLERIKEVKEFINSWYRSDVFKELDKLHVPFIKPPVKPTNIILKNPNFQLSVQMWEYIRNYGDNLDDKDNEALVSAGNDALRSLLDNSFLIDYFVMDSVSKRKREEKEKVNNYSIILLADMVRRVLDLLRINGKDITEEELLNILLEQVKIEQEARLAGIEDIKKKFKSEINEYLERTYKNL
jgi:hypothetical protein